MVVEKYEEPSSYLIEHPNGDLIRPNGSHLCDGTPLKSARIADKNSSIVHRGLSTRRPSASFQCLVLSCCGLIWVGLLWGPLAGSVMTTRGSRFGPTPGSWMFLLGVETGSLRPTYPAAGCIVEFEGFFMSLSVPSFESWRPSIGTSSILTSPLQHRKLSWLQMYWQQDSSATRFIPSLTSAPLAAADKSSTWGVILLNETWTVLEIRLAWVAISLKLAHILSTGYLVVQTLVPTMNGYILIRTRLHFLQHFQYVTRFGATSRYNIQVLWVSKCYVLYGRHAFQQFGGSLRGLRARCLDEDDSVVNDATWAASNSFLLVRSSMDSPNHITRAWIM